MLSMQKGSIQEVLSSAGKVYARRDVCSMLNAKIHSVVGVPSRKYEGLVNSSTSFACKRILFTRFCLHPKMVCMRLGIGSMLKTTNHSVVEAPPYQNEVCLLD
eukprot:c26905_g2_i2 orf=1285-1593(-)